MYFFKRLLFAIPLLLVISALAFALVHLAPGGPFDRERAPASPEIERNLKAKYHLDEPVWKQYLRYLGDLAHGDFGVSLKYRNHTVNDIIAQGLPVSMTARRAGVWFCDGCRVCRWAFSPRPGAAVGWIMPAVFWRCSPCAFRALSSRRS